jgi:DNA-binding HxlR family transcriptional regulator
MAQRLYSHRIMAELRAGPRTLRQLHAALGEVSYGALAVALHRLRKRQRVTHQRTWLAAQPAGRFEFTFTPRHGSWLNLVEGFFSKSPAPSYAISG